MLAPLVPSPLDYVGRRRFALYPPIAPAEPNEWILGISARSEVQVVNAKTGTEIWISRQYIRAVSENSTGLLVALAQPLEVRQGAVEPKVKRVIEMPPCSTDRPFTRKPAQRASVVEIRLGNSSKSRLNRAVLTTCTGAIVLALLAALVNAAIRF